MSDGEIETARSARTVGVVMALTMIAWMGAQLFGASLGLPAGLVFVVDAAALVIFLWALVATFRIWQRRRDGRK